MATIHTALSAPAPRSGPHLDAQLHPAGRWAFMALLAGGLLYAGFSILADTQQVGEQLAFGVFLFLGLALVITVDADGRVSRRR